MRRGHCSGASLGATVGPGLHARVVRAHGPSGPCRLGDRFGNAKILQAIAAGYERLGHTANHRRKMLDLQRERVLSLERHDAQNL